MTDPLLELEEQIRAAGHQLKRTWESGQDTFDGSGWVIRVDGERVAAGASLGAVQEQLKGWWHVARETSKPRAERMFSDSLTLHDIVKKIENAGRDVVVRSDDLGKWFALVDGERVVLSRSVGDLEMDLREWWEGRQGVG